MFVVFSFSVVNSLWSGIPILLHVCLSRHLVVCLVLLIGHLVLLIYIIIIATADVCCHFRVIIILLTFPGWEMTEEYTQASGGNKHQLYC